MDDAEFRQILERCFSTEDWKLVNQSSQFVAKREAGISIEDIVQLIHLGGEILKEAGEQPQPVESYEYAVKA